MSNGNNANRNMLLFADAAKAMKTQHVNCSCWKTERFIWTSKCVDHPIQDPWAYGYEELRRIAEDAQRGIFPNGRV
jgi:hypothetical protein